MATLLIIDDSERQRRAIRTAVIRAGIFDEVSEADDGLKGLRLALEKSIDVVVCRLELTGLDGAKLISVLKQDPECAAVSLVCLTTQTDGERRARVFHAPRWRPACRWKNCECLPRYLAK